MSEIQFSHKSVLLFECIEALNIRDGYTYVDCTAGGGGHSLEIAKRLSKGGRLIAIDRDDAAIAAATERLKEYIVKGFTLDDERLKKLGGGNYWKELLERIRDIRATEPAF